MRANQRLLFPTLLVVVVAVVAWVCLTTQANEDPANKPSFAHPTVTVGLAAWDQVYSVLTSPRCINCHTAQNYPQQGDDRHRHFANVIRGEEGRGVPALRCITCHQEVNADSTGVPGGPDWHLAPLSMQWQDKNDRPLSSATVCAQITDRKRNENMDRKALLEHHSEAALVLWAWNPGRRPDGSMRTLPPLSHAEFVNATRTWVEAGTPCPRGR